MKINTKRIILVISEWSAEINQKVVKNMNLSEVQAAYFILNCLDPDNYTVKLYVKNGCKIFSADFLKLSETGWSVIQESFDEDFDFSSPKISIASGAEKGLLWAKAAKTWNDSFSYPRQSVKLLDHPQLLLEKVKAFIGNLQIEDYKEFSTLAYNTEYIDGKKFNFCLLPESNYELFTIEVSEN